MTIGKEGEGEGSTLSGVMDGKKKRVGFS